MASFMTTSFVALSTFRVASGGTPGLRVQGNLPQGTPASRAPDSEHQLVICNAYASPEKMDIVQVSTRQVVTDGAPLAYKHCKDFTLSLSEGEQLDFKAGGREVGTFFATGLPKKAASLLLVPHRKTPRAVGCSFESHAFSDVQSPQLAVIDVYHGKEDKETAVIKIIETELPPDAEKDDELIEEELRFNSVNAISPGKYNLALVGADGRHIAVSPLKASNKAKYVVMRLGVENITYFDHDSDAQSYPQELMLFPENSARQVSATVATLIAALAAFHDAF